MAKKKTRNPFHGFVRMATISGGDVHLRTEKMTVAILSFQAGWPDEAREFVCDAINEKIDRDNAQGVG